VRLEVTSRSSLIGVFSGAGERIGDIDLGDTGEECIAGTKARAMLSRRLNETCDFPRWALETPGVVAGVFFSFVTRPLS